MNLLDIISLAKAGYKKADIDELLAIPIDEPEPEPAAGSTDPDDGSKGEPEPSPEPSANDPDYEQLYNDLRSELEKVKNDLKVAQDANRKKPVDPGDPDPMADLADVFRSYM